MPAFHHLPLEIIHADQLRVVNLTPHSAVLQWRPLPSGSSGHYELQYNSAWKKTRQFLPGDSSWVALTNLEPDTTYTASLRPESNQWLFDTLFVNFTTFSGERFFVIMYRIGKHT